MSPSGVTVYERLLRIVGHSGVPGRHRLVGRLAPPVAGPRPFRVGFFGLDYVGDLSEHIDRSIFYFGAYAPQELEFLARSAGVLRKHRSPVTFFDIGANLGQHSLFLSRQVDAVHAFEPSLRAGERLRANAERNGLANIVVHPVALGDEDATGTLGSGFPGNSGSRSLSWTLPGQPTEPVTVRHAGGYFAEHGLPRIDLMKLDVEGYESRVLAGLAERLKSDRPVILMELIGNDEKGGFSSVRALREALYPDHELRSLGDGGVVAPFDWGCESAIVLPRELASAFT
jgi:FkbM family methyltransferase